jgi:hypothetical protein
MVAIQRTQAGFDSPLVRVEYKNLETRERNHIAPKGLGYMESVSEFMGIKSRPLTNLVAWYAYK